MKRDVLRRRAGQERAALRAQLDVLAGALDRTDRGIGTARRFASRPVIIVVGIAAVLLLGRGRGRKLLTAGLTLLGMATRVRSFGQLLAGLAGTHAVRRSR